jgi:hypothetical protein
MRCRSPSLYGTHSAVLWFYGMDGEPVAPICEACWPNTTKLLRLWSRGWHF